jgi:soluble lytic murein transglycosylase-like protein
MTMKILHGALLAATLLALSACTMPPGETVTETPDKPLSSAAPTERPGRAQSGLRADAERARTVRPLIARHAAAAGVPVALADAVIRVESRYNPRAANAGNYGLMQVRLQTARSIGYAGAAGGLLDADTNLRYGMRYLAEAHRLAGGDVCRTIMKYQSGHRAIRLSAANRAYCGKVKAIMAGREV